MPIETKEKEIKGVTFRVTQLGFSNSRKTLVLLSQILGPGIKDMLSQISIAGAQTKDKKAAVSSVLGSLGSMDVSSIGTALGGFLERLNDSDLEKLTNTFAEDTLYAEEGARDFMRLDKANRELLFGGDGIVTYFQWLIFCIEANYSSFFSGASGRPGAAQSPETPVRK